MIEPISLLGSLSNLSKVIKCFIFRSYQSLKRTFCHFKSDKIIYQESALMITNFEHSNISKI